MYIRVKVKAGARKEEINKKAEDYYIISVREKALKNEANRRICEIISFIYNVSVNKIKIINGHKKPSKLLSVDLT